MCVYVHVYMHVLHVDSDRQVLSQADIPALLT